MEMSANLFYRTSRIDRTVPEVETNCGAGFLVQAEARALTMVTETSKAWISSNWTS